MINGQTCSSAVVINQHCVPGAPDYDPEGAVCGNDGQPDEAYCSYSVGPTACAYCLVTGQVMINGQTCSSPVVIDQCVPGAPDYDPEGAVCGNDGQPDEAYCSYSVGFTACAYCAP